MALSEINKRMLSFVVDGCVKLGMDLDVYREMGPAQLIAHIIEDLRSRQKEDIAANFEENRAEAERYLAGILGMM